eukprot:6476109-Prymnesium_polylepis.1
MAMDAAPHRTHRHSPSCIENCEFASTCKTCRRVTFEGSGPHYPERCADAACAGVRAVSSRRDRRSV